MGISDTHCGAGCALGGVISEWVLFVTGATIAGVALWPEYIADFALAFAFGIAFQYFAIAPGAARLYGIDEFAALRGLRGRRAADPRGPQIDSGLCLPRISRLLPL